jgi:tetratricopeptide (TPR) repeat protein
MRLMEFTGARRIPLVGRRDLLGEVRRRIGRGGIHLLHVEGSGGIGKTALLEAVLQQSQRGTWSESLNGCVVAREVIDLYHVDVHTSEGLIRRIVDVLGKWSFEQTEEALATLDRARAAGDLESAGEHARALHSAFFAEFASLTEEGVVLAFDTLEVLEAEDDPFQAELGLSLPTLGAGDWLLHLFLPALQGNVVVLLAGRPTGLLPRLEALREHNPRLLIHHAPLEALLPEETEEYLMAVAQAEARRGDGDAAARLWTTCEEHSEIVHTLTGGRPILLALTADLLAHGWTLPESLDCPPEALGQQDELACRMEIERALIDRVQSPTPIGGTLRALAWLRKGATPELLARVMDVRTPKGEWDIYTAAGYLEQVAQLALVKVRPGTRTVFLHDELAALLEEHLVQRCSQEERDRIFGTIHAYYRDLTRELEQRIEEVPPVFASLQDRLHQAYVEEMHYRLRHCPPLGFAMYFWLAEEALGGRDSEMDMLLHTEFLRTLAAMGQHDYHVGYVPREAEVDSAVRWGMRALFLQNEPDAALDVFDQVRRRWGKEAGKLRLAWAHMQLYQAVAQIQRATGADWQEARSLLAGVEGTADQILLSPPESPVVKGHRWQARIVKSLALNFRGYLDRKEGRYLEAVRHYQEAAMLQRRLGLSALAPTLTNLSYVLALTGQAQQARLLSEEAERLARRSGRRQMLALALNVRALVEAYDGHQRTALHYADQALEVAAQLPSPRVRGLVFLSRARARRCLWDSLTEAERQHEPHFLEQTLKEANQAANLLRNSPADTIEALLERGCVFRELARVHHEQGNLEEAREYTERSRKDLARVAVLARAIDLPAQQALAWTNLGWLYYYVCQDDELEEALQQAYAPLPAEYLFSSNGPLPAMAHEKRRKEATLPYWTTLGKVEMLKARLALDCALACLEAESRETQLRTAVKHITLSLAYDELVADSFFDLTRAEERLHGRILHDDLSIRALHQHAQEVAKEQNLAQPTRFQAFLERMFGPADLWA